MVEILNMLLHMFSAIDWRLKLRSVFSSNDLLFQDGNWSVPFTYDLLPALTIEIELLRFVFLAQMAPHTVVCIIIFGYVVRRKERALRNWIVRRKVFIESPRRKGTHWNKTSWLISKASEISQRSDQKFRRPTILEFSTRYHSTLHSNLFVLSH